MLVSPACFSLLAIRSLCIQRKLLSMFFSTLVLTIKRYLCVHKSIYTVLIRVPCPNTLIRKEIKLRNNCLCNQSAYRTKCAAQCQIWTRNRTSRHFPYWNQMNWRDCNKYFLRRIFLMSSQTNCFLIYECHWPYVIMSGLPLPVIDFDLSHLF